MSLAAFIALMGNSLIPEDLLFGRLSMCFLIIAGVTGGSLNATSDSRIPGST